MCLYLCGELSRVRACPQPGTPRPARCLPPLAGTTHVPVAKVTPATTVTATGIARSRPPTPSDAASSSRCRQETMRRAMNRRACCRDSPVFMLTSGLAATGLCPGRIRLARDGRFSRKPAGIFKSFINSDIRITTGAVTGAGITVVGLKTRKTPGFSLRKLDNPLDLPAEPCNNYPVQVGRVWGCSSVG